MNKVRRGIPTLKTGEFTTTIKSESSKSINAQAADVLISVSNSFGIKRMKNCVGIIM